MPKVWQKLKKLSSTGERRKEFSDMHYGSKGWYVEELKKKGITHYEGRKLQSFKKYFLANLLETKKQA